MASRKTLLLSWVYDNPVGRVVEGMKIARGYRAANRGFEVHMMVNADAPAELAERAPWIDKTWAIDFTGGRRPEWIAQRTRRR